MTPSTAPWTTKTLTDLLDLVIDHRGKTPKKLGDDWQGSGIPAISAKNIKNGQIVREDTIKYVSPSLYKRWMKQELEPGDILLTSEAPLGQTLFLKRKEQLVLSQRLFALRANPSMIVPRYLCYYLESDLGQAELNKRATGATAQGIRQSLLMDVEVKYPPLASQKKIASILSAYDDLIENNLRRIKILEEMAQLLYREWFVNFRFPGHQKVRMVDSLYGGIPEGWQVSTIGRSCCSIVDGDWIETKDQGGRDFRLLQVSNIGLGRFVETGNFRYITAETFKRLNCTEVKPGHILVSRMPKPTGRAWLVTKMPWRMVTAVDVAILWPNVSLLEPSLLVNILNSPEQLEIVAKQCTGTTRERITRTVLSGLPIAIPPRELQERFTALADPAYKEIAMLAKMNQLLASTRDLLLPRLISGQLDVTALDIRTSEDLL